MTTQQTVTDLLVRVGLLALTFLGVTDDSLTSTVQAAIVAGTALVFAVITWQRAKTHRRTDALAVQAAQVKVNQTAASAMAEAGAVMTTPALSPNLAQLDRILTPELLASLVGSLLDQRTGTVAQGASAVRHGDHEQVPA